MQTHLRPMSLGEILDRTAQLYRTNFLLLAGIAAVYAGVLLVLNLVQIGLQELLLHLHMAKQVPLITAVFILIIFPIMVVCAGAAVAANNRAVAWLNLDQPATIWSAYRSILPRMGRYLWLMAIVFFFVYIPFFLISIAYFVFLFAYGIRKGIFAASGANSDPQAAIVVGLVTIGFFIVAMGAVVYAVLMTLRYALAVPAAVIEDLPARKAIRRSIELTKGSRGRIFLLFLLIFVIEVGLVAVTQVFFMVAVFTAAKHHAQVPVWIQILQQIVGFLTNSFIGPMYATGITLFYYDQRIRKEGFDIEQMMEAAGMTAASAVEAPAEPVAGSPESWPAVEEPTSESTTSPQPDTPATSNETHLEGPG